MFNFWYTYSTFAIHTIKKKKKLASQATNLYNLLTFGI